MFFYCIMHILLDIGGSGIKLAVYDSKKSSILDSFKFSLPVDKENYNRTRELTKKIVEAVEYIKEYYSYEEYKTVCISTGGLIQDNLIIYWGMDINICLMLKELGYEVFCCHDGLAHLMGNIFEESTLKMKENIKYPALCLGFGTGVAFCVTNENGIPVKQCNGNDEIGSMTLSLKDNGVHGLLGYSSFKEAMKTKDFTSYNFHLKQLINNLVSVYSVKTLIISGGITNLQYQDAYLHYMTYVYPCIKNCKNIKQQNIKIVLGNKDSSLLGAYYFSLLKKTQTFIYTYQMKNYLDVLKENNTKIKKQNKSLINENIILKTLGVLFGFGAVFYFKNVIR